MNFTYIKKIIIIISLFAVTIGTCGCGSKGENAKVNTIVLNYLEQQGVSECYINSCDESLYDCIIFEKGRIRWDVLIQKVEYVISEEQVVEYSVNVVNNYEYVANLYGLDLKDYYINILGLGEEDFYQQCYSEGLYDIQRALLVGYIAEKEHILVSEEDIKQFCNREEYDMMQKDPNLKNNLMFGALEEKVVVFLEGYE
ncbi:MAG: hypothetical protein IJD40_02485 [Lachnospiraceae bacterium]|nr:hypothetical protein [Lachnospiraceae bacterium]